LLLVHDKPMANETAVASAIIFFIV
jgi:hypothetical protein